MNQEPENQWQELFDQLPTAPLSHDDHEQTLRQQALDVYDRPETSSWKHHLKSTGEYLMTHKISRWTATAAAALAAIWFLIPGNSNSTFAMDTFIKVISNAKMVQYQSTVGTIGSSTTTTLKTYCSDDNRMRMETLDGSVITIVDTERGKIVTLVPSLKTATFIDTGQAPEHLDRLQTKNWLVDFRDMIQSAQENETDLSAKPLGEQEIDGVTLAGFRVGFASNLVTVWANPQTGKPNRIEVDSFGTQVVMTDFEFNIELDESLFSTEIPDGYTTKDFDVSKLPTEEDLIQSFRIYSELANGEFPKTITRDMGKQYIELIGQENLIDDDNNLSQDVMDQVVAFQNGFLFAALMPMESQAHYAGQGVSRSTSERPIFWYKPEGQDSWRVLGASLKFRDSKVAPDVTDAVQLNIGQLND